MLDDGLSKQIWYFMRNGRSLLLYNHYALTMKDNFLLHTLSILRCRFFCPSYNYLHMIERPTVILPLAVHIMNDSKISRRDRWRRTLWGFIGIYVQTIKRNLPESSSESMLRNLMTETCQGSTYWKWAAGNLQINDNKCKRFEVRTSPFAWIFQSRKCDEDQQPRTWVLCFQDWKESSQWRYIKGFCLNFMVHEHEEMLFSSDFDI